MTDKQIIAVNAAIHTASAATAVVAGGLAQIPLADHVPIAAAQTAMIIAIGHAFGKELTESAAQIVLTQITTTIGRGLSGVLLGLIPGFGNVLKATTAVSLTEALGWAVASRFDREEEAMIDAKA